jgi:hypothetical protein
MLIQISDRIATYLQRAMSPRRQFVHMLILSGLGTCATGWGQVEAKVNSQKASQPALSERQESGRGCLPLHKAESMANREVCVRVHVFNIAESHDGTRFLDVCPPNEPDDKCHFVILSRRADREEVRGVVAAIQGRVGIVVSHARQFSGGPPKFKPNPKLLKGANSPSDRMLVQDPNLKSSGQHRSFMNDKDVEPAPVKP